jgi:hypothetical protein
VNREEDNLCGRSDSTYLVGCLDAIHHRHVDVQQDNIRLQLNDFFDGLFTTFSITADFEGMPVVTRAASSSLLISTKANPRGCPVNLSVTRLTFAPVAPACVNQLLISSCVAWNGKLPTYSFFKVAPLASGNSSDRCVAFAYSTGRIVFPNSNSRCTSYPRGPV